MVPWHEVAPAQVSAHESPEQATFKAQALSPLQLI